MSRKIHQKAKEVVDRDKRARKQLDDISKETGIMTDTEIVRYCINITHKQMIKTK